MKTLEVYYAPHLSCNMDRKKLYQIIVAAIMLVSMIYGRNVSFPDNVHNLHGFPLVWGSHQLITIAGPVDTWYVNLINLALDLVIWVGLILITPNLTSFLSENKKEKERGI